MKYPILATQASTAFIHTAWKAGDLVCLIESIFPNKPGASGIIYQLLEDGGIRYAAILLESGDDLGLLVEATLRQHVLPVGESDFTYTYSSPDQLMVDYSSGYFRPYFDQAHHYATKIP